MSDFENAADVDVADNAGNVVAGALSKSALEFIIKNIVDDVVKIKKILGGTRI